MNELLAPREMAEADRCAMAAGTPGIILMERAGKAVADAVLEDYQAGGNVVVICGPGNNGGDGFVAARLLEERGCPVRLTLFGDAERLKGDAAIAAKRWSGKIEAINTSRFDKVSVIVDALFGVGLARDLTGPALELVRAINRAGDKGVSVLAVDLPSGIDGATGQILGDAVRAHKTVTFCRKKLGHVLMPGRINAGSVKVADIGISDEIVTSLNSHTFENTPPLWRASFPLLHADGHKYHRGHAIVASGPAHATGAARLAARAALRMGAGLVTVAGAKDAVPILAGALTAVMVRRADSAAAFSKLLEDKRLNAVLLGPGQGMNQKTKSTVVAAAKKKRAMVLDADALNCFERRSKDLAKILVAMETVITPHEGEFRKLFADQPKILSVKSKVERTKLASKALGAIVVFKGPDTVVAAPDGRAAIAANGPPWLATAGSGDVLAGFIVGLLAQRMMAFEAACAAVWLHGESGQRAGLGMIAEDLSEILPDVLQDLLGDGL